MPTFSDEFNLVKTQPELDFVDVSLNKDNRLFVDPFALAQKPDRWSQDANHTLVSFFQSTIDSIRGGDENKAKELLAHLREPNETRLGYSRRHSQGAGIGDMQAEDLFDALRESSAVQTGFISSLEESELMIEGISYDKISDLTTNIIRGELAAYTVEQCGLHNVETREVAMPACFNTDLMDWEERYLQLPIFQNRPILLVPKSIVRRTSAYQHPKYYQHFVLNYLQREAIRNRAWFGLCEVVAKGSTRRTLRSDIHELRRFSTTSRSDIQKCCASIEIRWRKRNVEELHPMWMGRMTGSLLGL